MRLSKNIAKTLLILFISCLGWTGVQAQGISMVVTNNNESGTGSLKAAIGYITGNSGVSEGYIFFDLPVGDEEIDLSEHQLLDLSKKIEINGALSGGRHVILDGQFTNISSMQHGFKITADNCVIRNIEIKRFNAKGIHVFNASNTLIENVSIHSIGVPPGILKGTGIYVEGLPVFGANNLEVYNSFIGCDFNGDPQGFEMLAGVSNNSGHAPYQEMKDAQIGSYVSPNVIKNVEYGVHLSGCSGIALPDVTGETYVENNAINGNVIIASKKPIELIRLCVEQRINDGANHNITHKRPTITSANKNLVAGSSDADGGDLIEVFAYRQVSGVTQCYFVGSTTANSTGAWSLPRSSFHSLFNLTTEYTVYATGTDGDDNTSEYSDGVPVCEDPVVDFSITTDPCAGRMAFVDNLSTNTHGESTYLWNSHYLTSSTDVFYEEPTLFFTAPFDEDTRTHNVTLEVNNGPGCIVSVSKNVTVYNETIHITTEPFPTACEGESFTLTSTSTYPGSSASFNWEIESNERAGEIHSFSGESITPSGLPAGTYRVRLAVSTSSPSCAAAVTLIQTLHVNPMPTAEFTYEGCGKEIHFTANHPPDGTTHYHWYIDGVLQDPELLYENEKTLIFPAEYTDYQVKLVTHFGVCESVEIKTISTTPSPVADFSVPSQVCLGASFTPENLSSPADPSNLWSWTYEGGNSTEFEPSISFDTKGIKTITLSVTGGNADCPDGTISKEVEVITGPEFELSAASRACVGTPYTVWIEGYDEDVQYTWELNGDVLSPWGEAFEASSRTFDFAEPGTYEIKVISALESDNNCQFEQIINVNVGERPEATNITTLPASCEDEEDGSFSFTINGTDGFTYRASVVSVEGEMIGWKEGVNGDVLTFDGLEPENYRVEIKDVIAWCGTDFIVTIEYGGAKIIEACADMLKCQDGNDGNSIWFRFKAVRDINPTGTFQYFIRNKRTGARLMNAATQFVFTGSFSETVFNEVLLGNVSAGDHEIVIMGDQANYVCRTSKTVKVKRMKFHVDHTATLFNEDGSEVVTKSDKVPVYWVCTYDDYYHMRFTPDENFTCNDFMAYYQYHLYKHNKDIDDYELAVTQAWKSSEDEEHDFEISDLKIGKYRLVMDAHAYQNGSPLRSDCEDVVFEFEIRGKAVYDVTGYDVHNPRCEGDANGWIKAHVGDDLTELFIYWRDAGGNLLSDLPKVVDLPAGNYTFEISDREGCTNIPTQHFTLVDPPELLTPDVYFLEDDCGVEVWVDGGTPGYLVEVFSVEEQLSADGSMMEVVRILANQTEISASATPNASGYYVGVVGDLEHGRYEARVTDSQGCSRRSEYFTVKSPHDDSQWNVCFNWNTPYIIKEEKEIPEVNQAALVATDISLQIEAQTQDCVQKGKQAIDASLDDICMDLENVNDQVSMNYTLQQGHYTLYYYDRADNLVRTVAPEGVNMVANRGTAPDHKFVSTNDFNSLGQKIEHVNPDGGEVNFKYNDVGKVRFSQTAQQRLDGVFSYVNYDQLGRSIETGVANGEFLTQDVSKQPEGERSEVTHIYYSTPASGVTYFGRPQRYLNNRVSYTTTENHHGGQAATYYSYDPHGNVEWLVQDVPGMARTMVAYEYDLLTSNVNKILFNEGRADQYFHRYTYDENSRIVMTETSVDGRVWDEDVKYEYYADGKVSRMEIGHEDVQGIDYFYTIQGWLKGMNTPTLDAQLDYGRDGTEGSQFAKDVFGMALHYYEGDYKRSGAFVVDEENPFNSTSDNPFHFGGTGDLYAGNVTALSSKIAGVNDGDEKQMDGVLSGQQFTYDKLGRLRSSNMHGFNESTGAWESKGTDYGTSYTYDANGNIKTLERRGYTNGAGNAMDQLTYNYDPNTNRLTSITDAITAAGLYNDISTQAGNNYQYDADGRIVRDLSEGLTFVWNSTGKIAEIIPGRNVGAQKAHVRFWYDAQGRRVRKDVNKNPQFDASGNFVAELNSETDIVSTIHALDGGGTVMATYERTNTIAATDAEIAADPSLANYYTANIKVKELPIESGGRRGIRVMDVPVAEQVYHIDKKEEVEFVVTKKNQKFYEQTLSFQEESLDIGSESIGTAVISSINLETSEANPKLRFAGELSNNLALMEKESGQLMAYFAAGDFWGDKNTGLVFNKYNDLVKGSEGIKADMNAQAVFVRDPLNSEAGYLYVTKPLGAGLACYHVDMGAKGYGSVTTPLGEVTPVFGESTAVPGPSTGIRTGRHMAVLEDQLRKTAVVYYTQHDSKRHVTQLYQIEMDESGVNADKLVTEYNSTDEKGDGELQISPDANTLAVYQLSKKLGFFDHHEANILRLPLHGGAELSAIPMKYGHRGEGSFSYTSEGDVVVYGVEGLVKLPENTSSSNKAIFQTILKKGIATEKQLVQEGVSGDIRMGEKSGEMVRSLEGKTKSHSWKADRFIFSSESEDTDITLTSGKFTGVLAHQPVVIRKTPEIETSRRLGGKSYELHDHLGNVRVVVSDRKMPTDDGMEAEVLAYNNYYPFGMEMPGRTYSSDSYRYGYNGMEKDDDVKGSGNSYTTEFRQYDSRVGRWLTLDPLKGKFPSKSPYSAMDNNPIQNVDPTGLEPVKENEEALAGEGVMTEEEEEKMMQLRADHQKNLQLNSMRAAFGGGFTAGRGRMLQLQLRQSTLVQKHQTFNGVEVPDGATQIDAGGSVSVGTNPNRRFGFAVTYGVNSKTHGGSDFEAYNTNAVKMIGVQVHAEIPRYYRTGSYAASLSGAWINDTDVIGPFLYSDGALTNAFFIKAAFGKYSIKYSEKMYTPHKLPDGKGGYLSVPGGLHNNLGLFVVNSFNGGFRGYQAFDAEYVVGDIGAAKNVVLNLNYTIEDPEHASERQGGAHEPHLANQPEFPWVPNTNFGKREKGVMFFIRMQF